MFATGYFKTWWGKEQFIKSQPWSFFWPITLFFSFKKSLELIGKVNLANLIGATPFLYLIYLGVQAPFPRYFLILLPFAYLNLAEVGARWLFTHKHKVQF
mgnify:CR=1 FL=1